MKERDPFTNRKREKKNKRNNEEKKRLDLKVETGKSDFAIFNLRSSEDAKPVITDLEQLRAGKMVPLRRQLRGEGRTWAARFTLV